MEHSLQLKNKSFHLAINALLFTLCSLSVIAAGYLALNCYTYWGLSFTKDEPIIEDNTRLTPKEDSTPNNESILQAITKAYLFGIAAKKTITDTTKIAPETRLELRLIGTITESDLKNSSALVAEKGKPSFRYFIGESITDGVIVSEIFDDRITINREGINESLFFSYAKRESSSYENMTRARLKNDRSKNTTTNVNKEKPRNSMSLSDRLNQLKKLNQQQGHPN